MSPRLWILFFFWAGRPFPVILPHELLPWLMRNGAFPKVSCSDLASYWDHIDARSIPVGEVVNDEIKTKCHPLYIWGDDAQYNAQHEKVIVVVLGHVLDPNTYSLQCCWPLFCIREATWPLNLVDVGKLKRAMKKPNNIYIYVISILYWLFFLGIMDHHPYKYTWVLYIYMSFFSILLKCEMGWHVSFCSTIIFTSIWGSISWLSNSLCFSWTSTWDIGN